MLARLVLVLLIGALAACNAATTAEGPAARGEWISPAVLAQAADGTAAWYTGYKDDEPFDIPLVNRALMKPELMRQRVSYTGGEAPGTIVVDIDARFLYLVEEGGKAMRYGIGVGRNGFSWRGAARVGRKGVWPAWSPTDNMRRITPDLPAYMEGGIGNPLGARALYLYQGNRDTLFRIHGTNEPWSIGEAVSSGCVRLLNEDIVDLFERVPVGATVVVRRG
ncbi:L,D-transpeptidase [Salinarimonas sp.]|uniref:L,D-transpeptidase n=1 Tax=Salinarimonas sp. TaxID=2766526 RepID=UPI0032D8C5CF